jgi:predicted RNA-binding protein
MMACKEQIQQDITETLQSTELYPKILKYIELFSDHVDSSSLTDLYNVIKSGNNPSEHLLSTIVREAETNDKLLKWIEVLLRQF